ncbi:MAG: nucleotidyl transferase AbiEii/AbiGii toxin family protein [Candidatus Aenigmarchaeota archaeon]|nr:nucleotidyl transferase AbiEii/AbiGii toxin family protein [Candidatus Aenigmarchaeota archaeon]
MEQKKFPLNRIIKGKVRGIAELQDKIMVELASKFDIVLHGGTAIWRIYGGRRFSFDIDLYYKRPKDILDYFEKSENFELVKKRITRSDVVYLRFREGAILVEMEISPLFKKISKIDGEFNMIDGNSLVVNTLSATNLLKEKIDAFKNRKKPRDLYDIFFLLDFADTKNIRKELGLLLSKLKSEPADFSGLKEIILIGKSPDFETIKRKMIRYAKG